MNTNQNINTTIAPVPVSTRKLPELSISDSLKCCIEKTLHDIDIRQFRSLSELKKLFQPCERFHKNQKTSILTPVIAFFTSPNKSFEEKICRDAYCEQSPNNWNIFYIVVLVLTLMIAVLGNIIVCTVVIKDRPIRKRATNFFLLSLAVSDFFCSVSMLPVKISTALTNGNFCDGLEICQLYHTADHMFFAASVTHLFVVCIDRYTAIVKPYDYVVIFTHHRKKRLLVLIWLYSGLWALITSFNKDSMGFEGTYYIAVFRCKFRNTTVINVMYLCVFFIPCMVMAVLYTRIWWIAVSQAKEIRKQHMRYQQSLSVPENKPLKPPQERTMIKKTILLVTSHNGNTKNRQKQLTSRKLELKATKVILTVFGTFLACWSPVIFLVTVNSFKKIHIGVTAYKVFCEFLPNLNSALNPFIYCLLHKDFQQGLKHILQKMSAQKSSFKNSGGGTRESSKGGYRNSFSNESNSFLRAAENYSSSAHKTSSF